MEVHFTPEIQARLDRLAAESGRSKDELVRDAMPGYLDELERTRGMLDSRYDDVKSGKVKLIDGEEAFQRLIQKTATQPNPKA
jgi:predicted DNA-binding protein